jgi:hypothetical protein
MIKFYIKGFEQRVRLINPACSEVLGKRIEKCVIIQDLTGFTMSMANPTTYRLLKLIADMSGHNYPEFLGTMMIVNAPMLFTGVWTLSKHFVDEKTRTKIKIIGGSF